jgi:hypothetical protein
MPQMSQVLWERAIGMLIAGMSNRAVARYLNVIFLTINHLQPRFRKFGSMPNRPYDRRPHVIIPAQDLQIRLLHLRRGGKVLRSISVCNKALCGEKLILNAWAWLPSGWTRPPNGCAPAQSCEIHRLGPNLSLSNIGQPLQNILPFVTFLTTCLYKCFIYPR